MNAITPENEIPPLQSTAASGMLPIEQTNASAATIGPTTTLSAIRSGVHASVRKRLLKNVLGSVEMYPAMTKPARSSFQSIVQSPRKLCATSDHDCREVTLRLSETCLLCAE